MTTTTFRGPVRLAGAGSATGPGSFTTALRSLLERQASRRALAALDEHQLADVGLTREQAMHEAAKPFWVA